LVVVSLMQCLWHAVHHVDCTWMRLSNFGEVHLSAKVEYFYSTLKRCGLYLYSTSKCLCGDLYSVSKHFHEVFV
jgi:hypothetical protein